MKDADSLLFCVMFYIWKCVSVAKKELLSYYFHKCSHWISQGCLGFRAAVITLMHRPIDNEKNEALWQLEYVFQRFFIKNIFLILLAFAVVNSCCSFFRALFTFFCCCLELKIIWLLNSDVLVDTLSGIQTYLKWAFRVIVLMFSLHLSFSHL